MRKRMGTPELARLAETSHHDFRLTGKYSHGFTELGHGCTRKALLGPDDVVYKVLATEYCDCSVCRGCVGSERKVFELLDLYQAPWCPDFWFYKDVVAMRKYQPLTYEDFDSFRSVFPEAEQTVMDLGRANVGTLPTGGYYLLDGGAGLRREGQQRLSESSWRS